MRTLSDTSHAVFISYASQDAEVASRICQALRAAGIEVWFDRSELRGGDAWDQKIRREIRDCALFIPVISANTAARHEGYFRLEWDLADQRSHMIARNKAFIVPVCLDHTPETGADVPEPFQRVQWTRLPDGDTPSSFTARIVALLGAPPADSTQSGTTTGSIAPVAAAPVVTAKLASRLNLAVIALLAVAAVVLVYVAVDRFRLSKHAPGARAVAAVAPAAAPPVPAVTERSVAVLPFVDLSEHRDQQYFADGVADEVLTLLAKNPELRVIGRTSSFQFRDKAADLRDVGTTLGASYVVEGSVQRSEERIRVTAQLIDTRDGSHRWSETYDRPVGSALVLEDEIASGIARALQITILENAPHRSTTDVDPKAYDFYLRGLRAMDTGSQTGVQEAVASFQQALAVSPQFVPALIGVADANIRIAEQAWIEPRVAFERARDAANRALALDPKSGDAYAALARVKIQRDWDWSGAAADIKHARALGAGVNAVYAEATLAAALGHWDEAKQYFNEALAKDGLNPQVLSERALLVELRSGRCDDAVATLRQALKISPELGSARYFLGIALLCQGQFTDALAVFEQETIEDGRYEGEAMAYHALGKRGESDRALQKIPAEYMAAWPTAMARAHAYRGDTEQAIAWLTKAYAGKDEDMFFIQNDPMLTSIAKDSRYQQIVRQMGLVP
jgi:TolB-like protein/tetratricopeptide (TPR) repeat protein